MPNWCTTTYKVIGDNKQLNELYSKLKSLPDKNEYGWEILINDFFASIDYDTNGDFYRGQISSDIELNDNVLTFEVTSAYRRYDPIKESINIKYPALDIYYYESERGNCVFETNDVNGKFFGRYMFYNPDSFETKFFNDEKKLLSYASESMHQRIKTIEQLEDLLYNSDYDFDEFDFQKVTIRDSYITVKELNRIEFINELRALNVDVDKILESYNKTKSAQYSKM